MCTLTEPVPGIVIDFLHPNILWLYPAAMLVMCAVQLVRLRRSLPGKGAGLSVHASLRPAILACLCLLLGAGTAAFVGFPTEAAQRAWEAREEAILPAECIATVIEPAYSVASGKLFFVYFGLFLLPTFTGGQALHYTLKERSLTRR